MSGSRRRRLIVLALAAAIGPAVTPPRAHADPEWVDKLRQKADDWKQGLKDALERLDDTASQAASKLSADMKQRLAELKAILEAQLDAVEHLVAAEAKAYEAVIAARLREASAVADQLADEVQQVIAGTRTKLDLDRRRLTTGARQIVDSTLREAGVALSNVKIVDQQVVARAVANTKAEAKRWLGAPVAAGGVVLILIGAGLIWQRRRKGEWKGRRWLMTAGGAVLIGGGVTVAVLGVRHWLGSPPSTQVAVGIGRCDALADAQRLIDAGHAAAAPRAAAVAALERCQLLAADDATSELVTDRLLRVRTLTE